MTNNEIKKAWNKFKKEITSDGDPLNLKGCAYMTAQQMEKRTATIDLGGTYYGKTKCLEKATNIMASYAYMVLTETIGIKSIGFEERENAYYNKHLYMRINY